MPRPGRTCESALAEDPGRGDDKDGVSLSPHKFVGGPQTPGVLVARRELFRNRVPTVPGGGVITYVSPAGQWYIDDPVAREEGGTPAIVESIRAGLVFWAQGAHRRRHHLRPGRSVQQTGAGPLVHQREHRTARQHRRAAATRSSRSGSGTRTGICTTTSLSRFSTISSASRPAADVPAPARTATSCSASTPHGPLRSSIRSAMATWATARLGPDHVPLHHV